MSVFDDPYEEFPDLWNDNDFAHEYLYEEPCPECGGTGEVPEDGTNQVEC